MAKPKVTVIIPVHNTEKYLEECLNSIFNQTLKDIQIICVDDGSSDNSYGILYDNQDRITLLQTDNKGASCARNEAFKLAKGSYTAFLDSDDTIPENYLESLYTEAKRSKADVVITGFNFNRGTSVTKFKNPLPVGIYSDFSDKLKALYNGALWNKLFKTSLIKKNKLTFEEGRMWEDNLFVIQALYFSDLVSVIYEPFYNYRINENSVTNSRALAQKRIDDAKYIYAKTMEFAESMELNEKNTKEVEAFLKGKAMPNYILN